MDNLDEIAVEGSVQFFAEHDPLFGEGTAYTSPIVNSPTWLEVAALAHEMIKTTGDLHHQLLEGVSVVGKTGDLKQMRFVMGSWSVAATATSATRAESPLCGSVRAPGTGVRSAARKRLGNRARTSLAKVDIIPMPCEIPPGNLLGLDGQGRPSSDSRAARRRSARDECSGYSNPLFLIDSKNSLVECPVVQLAEGDSFRPCPAPGTRAIAHGPHQRRLLAR